MIFLIFYATPPPPPKQTHTHNDNNPVYVIMPKFKTTISALTRQQVQERKMRKCIGVTKIQELPENSTFFHTYNFGISGRRGGEEVSCLSMASAGALFSVTVTDGELPNMLPILILILKPAVCTAEDWVLPLYF